MISSKLWDFVLWRQNRLPKPSLSSTSSFLFSPALPSPPKQTQATVWHWFCLICGFALVVFQLLFDIGFALVVVWHWPLVLSWFLFGPTFVSVVVLHQFCFIYSLSQCHWFLSQLQFISFLFSWLLSGLSFYSSCNQMYLAPAIFSIKLYYLVIFLFQRVCDENLISFSFWGNMRRYGKCSIKIWYIIVFLTLSHRISLS